MEMTCWEGLPPPEQESEIISIGLCELDCNNNEINRKNHYYVRPSKSEISDYCTELTGIRNDHVKKAPYLKDVCATISKQYSSNRTWSAWGRDDIVLKNECDERHIVSPCSQEFLNIGGMCSLLYGTGKSMGLKQVIKNLGFEFEGQQHNALDDAINTAIVFQEINNIMKMRLLLSSANEYEAPSVKI